jgi:hypothetical protein
MLISVVENGFGKSAKVPGYYLAGKTGTAEVPIKGASGYYSDKTIQSFIGFGPALKPQFLILVKYSSNVFLSLPFRENQLSKIFFVAFEPFFIIRSPKSFFLSLNDNIL